MDRWLAGPRVRRLAVAACLLLSACGANVPPPNYDMFVWPPPPDEPRIKLEDVILGRADILAKRGGIQRALLGASSASPFDWLKKPHGVAFDSQGRLLVSDSVLGAVFRLSRSERTAEVLGRRGVAPLQTPLGLRAGPGNVVYVADTGLRRVAVIDDRGAVVATVGKDGEMLGPADVALSQDGLRLFVADSLGHRIVVYEIASGRRLAEFGTRGAGEAQLHYPAGVAVSSTGQVFVVDQMNARIQVFDSDGHFVESFGSRGVGPGSFVRPKGVAIDELGLIYISDAAFGNVQILDPDLNLLTFVGSGGREPGQFQLASGVAVQNDRFAVVDQLNRRVQVFRFLKPKDAS